MPNSIFDKVSKFSHYRGPMSVRSATRAAIAMAPSNVIARDWIRQIAGRPAARAFYEGESSPNP
ncbi:hypothetical protein [Bradyrhizobium rifense]|uniref:hypothetical protein n=1 Tax=Bradyrhizobium rifense TaxID=515499 RepID=UPI001AEDDCB3|nr:hypothetical protein [Bradyrhizobium rifense]